MFYGWKLAFLSSFGNFMLQGGVLYVMNAFMEPLTEMHGWSRAGMSIAMGIASLCGTLSMSGIAYMASKYSLRRMITIAAFIGGIAFISLGYVNKLWLFTICFALVWITGQVFGGVGANILTQRWFVQYRGRAFGLVNVGTSLSGAILPFLALFLVDSIGVMWAYTLLGSFVLVCVPLCYVMIRDTPSELDLLPDGIASRLPIVEEITSEASSSRENSALQKSSESATQNIQKPLPTVKELLSNPLIILIGVSFSIGLMVAAGVVSQLKPRFVDAGFDSYTAMTWMCLTALCAAIGKYLWGWVADYISPLRAMKALFICNALSLSLSLLPQTTPNVILFAVAYGACFGGLWSLFPMVIAYMFGRTVFLLAYQVISMFVIIKACGYPIMGLSYGITGSYSMAYILFVGILTLTALAVFCIKETQSFEYQEKLQSNL